MEQINRFSKMFPPGSEPFKKISSWDSKEMESILSVGESEARRAKMNEFCIWAAMEETTCR